MFKAKHPVANATGRWEVGGGVVGGINVWEVGNPHGEYYPHPGLASQTNWFNKKLLQFYLV